MFKLVAYFSALSILFPFLTGIYAYNRDRGFSRGFFFFFLFILLCVGIQAWQFYLFYHHTNNLFLYHLFTPVQFVSFTVLFLLWTRHSHLQQLFTWSIPAFLLFWIFCLILWENPDQHPVISRAVLCILLFLGSLLVLAEMVQSFGKAIWHQGRFRVIAGIALYFGITSILAAAANLSLQLPLHEQQLFWTVHSVNIFANLLYANGFLCRK